MTDNELLLAIADIMDKKLDARLKPIEEDIQCMKTDIKHMQDDILHIQSDVRHIELVQENAVLPRLSTIESCYTTTYSRYKTYADKMAAAFVDIDLLKKVVAEHSEILQKIS